MAGVEPSPQEGGSESSAAADAAAPVGLAHEPTLVFEPFESELQLPVMMELIGRFLSEPYSIYTYRYFIHNWPHLTYLCYDTAVRIFRATCGQLEEVYRPLDYIADKRIMIDRPLIEPAYVAMLAVDPAYRKRKVGTDLVRHAIRAMAAAGADEVVLETEVTNPGAIALYEKLGFARDKMLFRYYLSGVDAIRLKLWLK